MVAQKKSVSPQQKAKNDIATAKANIKKGQNLENAEKSMRELLKDSANLEKEIVWLTLFDAVKKQYEQLNEKLYLKQQSDTAKLFGHTLHMFDVLESLDSIDAKPNRNGKISPSFRKKHANYLDPYRKNLYNGGLYYIGKQNFQLAYNYLDSYLDCANQPLFSGFSYSTKDPRMTEAAYWAVFCGYKLEIPEYVEKYYDIASKDSTYEVFLLQYKAEACRERKDMKQYRSMLELGFEKYPDNQYFLPHLMTLYGMLQLNNEVITIANKALERNPNNIHALVGMSFACLQLEKYDDCVAYSDRAIAISQNEYIPFLNAGLAYYNQAQEYAEDAKLTKEKRDKMNSLYRRALPYLENFRKIRPKAIKLWGKPLYNIYLNLNMGDEFEEIEKVLSVEAN